LYYCGSLKVISKISKVWFSLFSFLDKQLKGACPEHRIKDLEQLVADLKGDEEKIQQQLDIWWSEPVKPVEEEWADVNRTKAAAPVPVRGRGGGRGRGGREATSQSNATPSAGRGRSEGRGGRGGRGRSAGREPAAINATKASEAATAPEIAPPTDAKPSLPPKSKEGAWGKPKPKSEAKEPAAAPVLPTPPVFTPPASSLPKSEPAPISMAVGGPPGNVWATKGSAHLIRSVQEKPKAPKPTPPPKAPEPDLSALEAATASLQVDPIIPAPPAISEPPMPTSLPVPPNAWTQAPSEPAAPPSPVRTALPPPVAQPKQQRPKERTNVLNMGHWDTANDDDDDNNLDFGFGSFVDSDVPSSAPKMNAEAATTTSGPSPARPPPGLSIGGMPPMPPNAMLAHELEDKLEEASLNAAAAAAAAAANSASAPEVHSHTESMDVNAAGSMVPGSMPPNVFHTQTGYSPYPAPGMGGMYDYNAGNAFVQDGGAPGLGPPKSQPLPPSGLYGAQQPAPPSGNSSTAANSNGNAGPAALQPPGMHNMYGNPAMYYNQHHQAAFHMNQAAGGLGYNYGYGAQFGGAAGFGYPQAMGQSASGYPLYDESAGGSYPKSGGGYRGRNNNQYGQGQNQQASLPNQQQQQQQYNPQGYQPYTMGYPPNDHFARGGYGGMQDPYAMQQQHGGYGGGFNPNNNNEGNDQQRGKKGGNRGFSGHHPTQQFGQPLGGSTQPPPNNSGGAWPNNQAWGGSGAPSWQGAK
jgi:hypothetical protein